MAKDQFKKYIWIVDMLYRTKGISKKKLNEYWKRSVLNEDHSEIPNRTFIEYKKAIEDTFDITIACNASDGYKYYIENASDIQMNSIKSWLLSSFSINNMIQESKKLQKRIIFERIPSGDEHLIDILQAMQDGMCIELTYQGYHRDHPYIFSVMPYCLKVFKQRWYMVDKGTEDGSLRIHALDRIIRTRQTDQPFDFPSTFDAEAFFHDSYGIIVDSDYQPEKVRLKVYDKYNKRKYLRSLPLHHSQKEVERADGYSIFEYRVCPTSDFVQEILSHGPEVEILSPEWLREECRYYVNEMYQLYNPKNA